MDQLTSAICTSWSHTYSYDKAGNRTAKDSVTYTINTVNEVTALSDGTSFTYDSNGNRTQKTKGTDTWVYTYDYVNRLTKVEKNDTTLGEYIYDGDGKRLQVTENSTTTTYIYSESDVIYEENSSGTITYIRGPKGLLAKRTTINQESNTFYIHTDRSSSTRLVIDDNKNIVAAVTYHPFGELSTEEGSERYLFTGKEKDSTDLYYYGARYYDPEIGRFLTRDPYTSLPDDPRIVGDPEKDCTQWLMNPQRFNRFSYAANNPLKYNDPTGLHYSCIGDDCEELVGELREQNYLRREKIEDGKEENVGSVLIEALYGIGSISGGGGSGCKYVIRDCDGWYKGERDDTLAGMTAAEGDADWYARQGRECDDYSVARECEPIDRTRRPRKGICKGSASIAFLIGLGIFISSKWGKKGEL